MMYVFFVSWVMFPILFVLGPEGFGHLSAYGSTIGHTVADLLSKNLWGLLGHHLRYKIHEHILLHGDIRRKAKVNVAGEDMEIEEMVDEEDEDTVRNDTAQLYSKRASFIMMKNNMERAGVEVKATFDEPGGGRGGGGGGLGRLSEGRVILGLPDISMLEFFRKQFAALGAPIEVVPAIGADNVLAMANQAMMMGGADCVLLAPEFLRDRSPQGLVARLKMTGQRVCAFGWVPEGAVREVIETANLDGWVEGPGFGFLLNSGQFAGVLAAMQAKRGAMTSAYGGPNMYGAPAERGMGGMAGGPAGGGGGAGGTANPLYGMPATPGSLMGVNPAAGAFRAPGGGSPSPSQMQGGAPHRRTGSGGEPSDKEMMAQLLAEIHQLKRELGEQ